jgi:hypothetical protein
LQFYNPYLNSNPNRRFILTLTLTLFEGEFHCRFHIQDAEDLANKRHVLWPLFLHFGIKQLAANRILMKQQQRRENWTLAILSSTLKYLMSIYTLDELSNIPVLLERVKKCTPVYQLIGWAYYYGAFVWGCKKAVRVGDVEYLDWMWHYSLVMYGITGKNQYKKGCLQVMKVLHDSWPCIRKILTVFRTYSESSTRKCARQELDMLIEKVSPYANPDPNEP